MRPRADSCLLNCPAQAEGFPDKVKALHNQLSGLEGDDLLAVLESATLATSLATVLSQPRSETRVIPPDAPGGEGSPRRDARGNVVGGVGSNSISTALVPQPQQSALLLGAP